MDSFEQKAWRGNFLENMRNTSSLIVTIEAVWIVRSFIDKRYICRDRILIIIAFREVL